MKGNVTHSVRDCRSLGTLACLGMGELLPPGVEVEGDRSKGVGLDPGLLLLGSMLELNTWDWGPTNNPLLEQKLPSAEGRSRYW